MRHISKCFAIETNICKFCSSARGLIYAANVLFVSSCELASRTRTWRQRSERATLSACNRTVGSASGGSDLFGSRSSISETCSGTGSGTGSDIDIGAGSGIHHNTDIDAGSNTVRCTGSG